MMSNSPEHPLVSSLVKHGKSLATIRNLVSVEKTQYRDGIEAISKLLELLKNDQQLPAFFPDKAIPKIFDKIQTSLDKLKMFHGRVEEAGDYDHLVSEFNACKSYWETPVPSSLASLGDSQTGGTTHFEASAVGNEHPQQDQFAGLSAVEKKCLFCFCLFPDGKEVKKREFVHLWVATGLVAEDRMGGDTIMLDNLVAGRFIESTVRNRYKMNHNVYSIVKGAMNIDFVQDLPALSVMDEKNQQQQPPVLKRLSSSTGLGTFVLNISEHTIQTTTFEKISKLKNNVKVLHLGSWLHDSDRYIVAEPEAFKALPKHVGEVTLLSLEGVSGIVELPNSVYKLESLKVLDLRGCPNLESLSEGIDSLKQLTHLDLSECYLLDRIPKGIASLTDLRVLKGFVINPEVDPQAGSGEGNNGKKKASNSSDSCASFSDLKVLEKLVKLTIRTRRKSFPTSDDFDTLSAMNRLTTLRVAWSWNSTDDLTASDSGRFPTSLKKLELQAAPNNTVLRLFSLISNDSETSLEKLYIRGGRLWDLGLENQIFRHVQTVRLRYLIDLHIDWNEFRKFFPNITRLEVLECPNLIFFPCDKNGVWEKTSTK